MTWAYFGRFLAAPKVWCGRPAPTTSASRGDASRVARRPAKKPPSSTGKPFQDAPKNASNMPTRSPKNPAKHDVGEFRRGKWSSVSIKIGSQFDLMLYTLKITKMSFNLKVETSPAPTPYYSKS